MGGNTVMSDETSTLGGCWNGGRLIRDGKKVTQRIYASVPHGPENCVRCRFFITDARYLTALNAHFNLLSYKSHQAANIAVELEAQRDFLEDEKYFSEESDLPFIRQKELLNIQRRLESQLVEANEYASDWIATFRLIYRVMNIEEQRLDGDTKNKIVAVGGQKDLTYCLKFVETESELMQLSLLCDDAEIYPDIQDQLRKTPAVEKRSRELNRVLMKCGFEPIFISMDDKQQLVAGNAMLRQMAKQADPEDKLDGYRKVASYIEAGEYLENHQLLEKGLKHIKQKPIKMKSLSSQKHLETI